MSGASDNFRRSANNEFIRVSGEGKSYYREVHISGECNRCHEHCLDCKCVNLNCKYREEDSSGIFPGIQPGTKVYTRGFCSIMVSPPFKDSGWHMSISCAKRNPTWEEIRDAWYDLIPDADKRNGAMFFPPKGEYVNVHSYCFHIHEVPLDLKNMFQTHKV